MKIEKKNVYKLGAEYELMDEWMMKVSVVSLLFGELGHLIYLKNVGILPCLFNDFFLKVCGVIYFVCIS